MIRYGPWRTRYRSSSTSLSEPGGRGSSASLVIRSTTSRRSFFVGRSSISWEAERLISRLYLATPPQISNDTLKGEARLGGPLLESGKVLRVLCQACADRVVYKIRYGALRLGSLMTKRLVDLGLEIDGCPLRLSVHASSIAPNAMTSRRPQGHPYPLRSKARSGAAAPGRTPDLRGPPSPRTR